MVILLNIIIVIATFFLMEGAAWALHKYVMHGFLWNLHHDHHNPHDHYFEKNDSFLLIFAVPSFLLIYNGLHVGPEDFRVWIGAGIAIYGVAYFVVHDVFIHQRFKGLKRTNNPYFIAIRKAHKIHHKSTAKRDGECFGMLWVPIKYYREAWKYSKKLKQSRS